MESVMMVVLLSSSGVLVTTSANEGDEDSRPMRASEGRVVAPNFMVREISESGEERVKEREVN